MLASRAPADELVVRYADGRVTGVPIVTIDGRGHLRASDVSLLLGASVHWRPDLLKMTLRLGEHRVKLTAENPNVVVDGDTRHFPSPVLFREGDLLLPIDLVGSVLVPLVPFPARLDEAARVLHLGSASERILGVTLAERPDGLEATVRTAGSPAFDEGVDSAGAIAIRFAGLPVDDDALPYPPDPSLIRSWRWEVRPDSAILLIEPGEALVDRRVSRRVRPEGLSIRLASVPILDLAGEAAGAIDVLTKPKGGAAGGPCFVVIDPGHGGSDYGTTRPGLPPEKEITLDLALCLREELERRGVSAVLTREADAEMGARRRTETANRLGGGLLISLHMNGSSLPGGSRTETYVYSLGGGGEERIRRAIAEAAALYGNATLGGAVSGDIRLVPWEAVQEIHEAESRAAAERIAADLSGAGAAVPVRPGPVAVLKGADMPALLLEVAWSDDESGLPSAETEEGRTRLAGLLAGAIALVAGGTP